MPKALGYPRAATPGILISAARTYRHRTAVVDGEEQLSYQELHDNAKATAATLRAAGIGRDSVVGLHLPNGLHFLTAYYGALLTGAAVTLVNPLLPKRSLVRQLRGIGVDAVITHPAHMSTIVAAETELALSLVIVVPDSWAAKADDDQLRRAAELTRRAPYRSLADVLAEPAPDFIPTVPDADQVAHYAFTGGTTGESKAVRVLHKNLIANITQMTAWRLNSIVKRNVDGVLCLEPIEQLGPPYVQSGRSSALQVSPLFHAQGLTNMGMFVLGGITIVLSGRFSPESFVELAKRWGVVYCSGNPPMYLALAAHCAKTGETMPSIRMAVSGAAPLDSTAVDRIGKAMPNAVIGEGYGLTEATCMVCSTPFQRGSDPKVGSVGVPVPDTEVEIRALDGKTILQDGEEGELWVRGPQVTDGYSNAAEQTAAQFVDGWLCTGDIASRSPDGYVRIHDRAKDMLIYKGYNVYPRELEGIAAAHPGVAQVAVVGRAFGDAGEVPVAFVVLRAGAALSSDALIDWVADQVLPYQKIREVHFVDELPTSAAGKILKTDLRSRLDDQGLTLC
ncbi:class I adenylate-forming enzyme family protein [Brevibacterium daeguense]|nr:AMP-binding protein [Brevibacterium daeguense]